MDFKRTKIICTIGPASWDPKIMKGMINAGMNCARVNGAFADREEMDKVTKLVKAVSDNVGLMIDTKGPEVRLNKFKKPIPLRLGQEIVIGSTTDSEIYPANNLEVYKFLEEGQIIKVGDGDVELTVKEIEDGNMICEVIEGTLLKPGKALNMPGAEYSTEVLTEKDKTLIQAAKDFGWDFASASFISDGESAKIVADELKDSNLKLVAKIESQEGIDSLNDILPHVYGIMIARGGLGVELGLENVHKAQETIINKCIEHKRTVITATQFLESMIENPRPTRAEVDDVANCIEDRTDCVMLSGESSIGKHPVAAVEMLSKIAKVTEPMVDPIEINSNQYHKNLVEDSAIKAAVQFCNSSGENVDAVIAISEKGGTARLLGKYDIRQPIFALILSEKFKRHLSIDKGIVRALSFRNKTFDQDDTIENITNFALKKGLAKRGQKVFILISGKSELEGFVLPNFADFVVIE
jgi:pyruvate kinase